MILPGVFKLATNTSGVVPINVRLFPSTIPLPLPFKDSTLILLLAGMDASSVFAVQDAAGAKKLYVRLYNAIRAVGAVATVVNVPPLAEPEVVPIPTVGAAALP